MNLGLSNLEVNKGRGHAGSLVLCGLFAIVIAICSWISIPTVVPFTLQTLGVFLTLLILGGKLGVVTIITYLLMGLVGLPVFAGFNSGLASLIGPTGGYLVGFIAIGIIYWMGEALLNKTHWNDITKAIVLLIGLFTCYLLGTLWFVRVFTTPTTFKAALGFCVFPFVVPDLIKLGIAIIAAHSIGNAISSRKQ